MKSKNNPKELRIAISGSNSFIGRNIIQRLENDPNCKKICIFDQKPFHSKNLKTIINVIDPANPVKSVKIADILKRNEINIFIRCAFTDHSSKKRKKIPTYNLESTGTQTILDACKEAKIKKFILQSTTMVYGANIDNPNYISENSSLKGCITSPFVIDKVEAEKITRRFSELNENITVTVLRPCYVLGPTVSSLLTKLLSNKMIPVIIGYDPHLQFLHEVDLLDIFDLAIKNNYPGEFNIVGEGVLSLSEVLKITGKVPLYLPEKLVEPVKYLFKLTKFSKLSTSILNFFKYECVADGTKAAKIMNYKPKYTSKEALLSFIGTSRLRNIKINQSDATY